MQLVNKSIVTERASYFTIAMLWLEITRLSAWGYRRAAQVRVRWLVAVHTRDYRRWATRLQSSLARNAQRKTGRIMVNMLDSKAVLDLARVVEESTRSTREGVKYFIEPAPGTLTRAKN